MLQRCPFRPFTSTRAVLEAIDYSSDDDSSYRKKPSFLHLIDRNLINETLLKISSKKQRTSKRLLYVQNILQLLEKKKKDISLHSELKEFILEDLQQKIEKSTVLFDEKSIYKTSIDLFELLTRDPITNEKRSSNLRNILIERIKDDYIIDVLNSLNVYTVEMLVIYVLGQIFNDLENNSPIVKAVTLVEKLGRLVLSGGKGFDSSVYTLESEDEELLNIDNVINIDEKCKILGGELLSILISKGLLVFIDHPIDNILVNNSYKKYLYVKCLYDNNLIPIKFNLPMVVPPIPWSIEKKENDKTGQ